MRPLLLPRRDALRLLGAGIATLAAGRVAFAVEGPSSPAPALLSRAIPSSGERLPVVGVGTWQTFDVGNSAEALAPLREVLKAFVELGGRVIDSSPMYGRSEETVGVLARELGIRDRLFVATKVWTSGRAAGVEQMDDSMRKLHADPIDLMQVHNLLDAETHMKTLRAWKESGRIRYIGVTHYTESQHDAVAKMICAHPLDFIQINYSAADRGAEERLLPLAQERGVAVLVNRPFGGGGLLRGLLKKPLPQFAAEIECTSWAQLLLKFIISHPAVTCAIPGTSKANHLRDNMKACLGPVPDAAMRERIASAVG